jgi:DnaJ-class molecular chaperone|tara:strand:+ start:1501 stop:2490 length:990 start_codon:yes stop_codon:yes gene_type:complete
MDYYEILDISPNATVIDIRKAYHRLAVLYHPDKNPNDPGATQKFQQISEAYQVLSNECSRRDYDLSGKTDINIRSAYDLFEELFSDIDPIILTFLKNSFSDIKTSFDSSPKINLWELFNKIDRNILIEEGSNVVKHILKKSLTTNENTKIDSNYIYELKLNSSDIDNENDINVTIDCLRRFTHINLIISNKDIHNTYLLDLDYDEHVITYNGLTYTFYLIDDLPEHYKRYSNDILIERDINHRHITTGYYFENEYINQEDIEVNIVFTNKSNIVKIPNKGLLNKTTKLFGNLYIVFTFTNNIFSKNLIDSPDKPIYNTMEPTELLNITN